MIRTTNLRLLQATIFSLALLTCAARADLSPPEIISVDFNKDVIKVNFQCDPLECPKLEERINEEDLLFPKDVEIGLLNGRTFALVSSGTPYHPRIDLFTPADMSSFWMRAEFDDERAKAMVLTQNEGTLYAVDVHHFRSKLYAYALGACVGDPTPACWNPRQLIGEIKVGNHRCTSVSDIIEFPLGSGQLIASCKWPRALVGIDPVSGMQSTIVGSSSLPLIPTGVAATSFGMDDYLLVSTIFKKVFAYRNDNGVWKKQKKPVISLRGRLGGISTGRCVDGSACATVSNSGNRGRLNLVELNQAANGRILGQVIEVANNQFQLPGSGSFANVTTVSISECLEPGGCQIGGNQFIPPPNADPNGTVGAATLGLFPDSRWNEGEQNCDPVPLPLDFTLVPDLQGRVVGPEFCARGGEFFVDQIIAETLFTEGTAEFVADGDCFATGFPGVTPPDPVLSLPDVNYGLRAADLDDRFPSEDMEINDVLFDCTNPRRRGGESLSFYFEGFFGNDIFNVNQPEDLLYTYGDKVTVENIAALENDSSCFPGPTSACSRTQDNLHQAAVGWNLQDDSPASRLVNMTEYSGGGTMETLADVIPGEGVDLKVTAINGSLGFKTVAGFTALGVGGEINVGQAMTFSATSTPAGTKVEEVPFVADAITLAFLFDGPEFNDVEEKLEITATLADGSELVGTLQALYVDDDTTNPIWSLPNSTVDLIDPARNGSAAIIKVSNPFDGTAITALRIEPVEVIYTPNNPCPNGGSCSNQSDASVLDLEFRIVDRIDALKFAYDGLVSSLCDTSTRVGGRPSFCPVGGPFVSDFNTVDLNVAGRLQLFAESFARFVTQNICLLDESPHFDDDFCTTPQDWSDIGSP